MSIISKTKISSSLIKSYIKSLDMSIVFFNFLDIYLIFVDNISIIDIDRSD